MYIGLSRTSISCIHSWHTFAFCDRVQTFLCSIQCVTQNRRREPTWSLMTQSFNTICSHCPWWFIYTFYVQILNDGSIYIDGLATGWENFKHYVPTAITTAQYLIIYIDKLADTRSISKLLTQGGGSSHLWWEGNQK